MLRVAIIGAGPSGLFVAEEVIKRFPGATVSIYEKRNEPFGLLRFGVAPDHTVTKRAAKIFSQILGLPGCHLFTGVDVGRDVAWSDVRAKHDAVVVCTGAGRPNIPAIPGVEKSGVITGLDFARWVNGERDALPSAMMDGVRHVVIIGNGNVALDVARMLARRDEDWTDTAIAPYAREALSKARIQSITVMGRRGVHDASFTEAELAEVISMPGWRVCADQGLPLGMPVPPPSGDKTLTFIFGKTPLSINGGSRVVSVECAPGQVTLPADILVFATGQRGEAFADLPFDAVRGVIANDCGRVDGVKGVYVCGWIKRGAKGLIGQNRKDALETVARIREDVPQIPS